LVASVDADEHRTGFYPSPQLAGAGSSLEHARFLVRKLDALIANFAVPSGTQALRVTPSRDEATSLEQRAIPYYYQPASTLPMHRRWSYTLERRGMSTYNYGYHANAFGAEGGAAAPLTTQLGRFDFFRVEGHLGMKIDAAAAALEAEIKSKNLPLAIQPVMLGADRTKVFPWRSQRYTDLHRFHDLMRYSLSEQLDDAANYSGVLSSQLDDALSKRLLTGKQAQDARDAAVKTADTIKENASRASTKLRQPYVAFKQDESWRQDVSAGLLAAGTIKRDTTNIAKTEFPSATDSLLESTSLQWLDWLDIFIRDKGDKETGRMLFSAYVANHPGLEHAGGVARGGTLVVAYDEASSVVVADFALPYLCCAPEADEPPPPPSKPPKLKPGLVFERPLTLFNPIEERVQEDITRFWIVTEPKVKEQINLQKDYLQMYKDSVAAVGGIVTKDLKQAQVADRLLALQLDELDLKSQTRDLMQGMLLDPSVSEADKKRVREDIQQVESEIAKLANDTATRVVSLNLAIEPGGDGLMALTSANRQVSKLQSSNLRESFKQTMGTLQGATQNAKMKDVLIQLTRGV
jgi:hypothetical protein